MNWPPGFRDVRRVSGNSALSSFATSPTLQKSNIYLNPHLMLAGYHVYHSNLKEVPS